MRILFLFVAFLSSAERAEAFRFTVLHTNDLHSHFEGSGPDPLFTAKVGDGDPVLGHYARLAHVIREIRARKKAEGEPVLLVDAGDFFSGSLFHGLGPVAASPYVPELEFFNSVGYDAVTFGNHEFDAGNDGLATILAKGKAKFGLGNLVVTNAVRGEGAALNDVPLEIIKELSFQGQSLRVGILGFLSPDAARDCTSSRGPNHVVGFDDVSTQPKLSDFLALAKTRAEALRREKGATLIIALIHGGYPQDEALAKVPGIDLVVSGHTHKLYETPLRVGNTRVAQAGYYGKYLGVLELETGDKGLTLRNEGATYRKIDDSIEAEADILALIASYKKEVAARLKGTGFEYDTPVVTVHQTLEQNWETGEGLGPLVMSGIRATLNETAQPPVDVYFTSRSLIRENLPLVNGKPTPYQFSDLFRVLSIGFGTDYSLGSPVVSATFSKEDFVLLLQLLEVYRWISPHFALTFSDSLSYQRNPHGLPFLNRLKNIRLHGVPMSEVGSFLRVATNAYSAAFFPKLATLSHNLVHFQLRNAEGAPISEFGKEPVPSEPFLFSRFLKAHKF